MAIIVTNIDLKNRWAVRKEGTEWQAWISDPVDEDTGAPLATAYDFDILIDKMQVFEKGQAHESS